MVAPIVIFEDFLLLRLSYTDSLTQARVTRSAQCLLHPPRITRLLLTTGRQPSDLNRANFGSLQPRTANEAMNRAQLGMAGNRGAGSSGLAATRRGRQPGDKPPTGQPGMPRCLVAWLLSNRLD